MRQNALPPVVPFVGRRRDMARMADALDRERVVILSGEGGVGKTCLAAAYAWRQHRQGNRVCWVECPEGGEFAGLAFEVNRWLLDEGDERFAHALGDERMGLPGRLAALLSALDRHGALLCIDDGHRFRRDEMLRFLRLARAHLGEGRLLLVSRTAPVVEEGDEPPAQLRLRGWADDDSRSWAQRADEDSRRLVEWAERVKGHPLALQLCLILLKGNCDGHQVEALLEAREGDELIPRLVEAVLRELDPIRREILTALACFRVPVELRGLRRLVDREGLAERLKGLRDLGLVEGHGDGRIGLHDRIREGLLPGLDASRLRRMHSRCGEWYRDRLAEVAAHEEARRGIEPDLPTWVPRDGDTQARMNDWISMAVEAFHHTYEADEAAPAVSALCAVCAEMRRYGFNHELLSMIDRCLEAGFDLPLRVFIERARVLRRLGRHEESLEELRRLGSLTRDEDERAEIWSEIAHVHYGRSDNDLALRFYYKALSLRREQGSVEGEADLLGRIATIMKDRGEYERAIPMYEQARAMAREHGRDDLRAFVLHNLGRIHGFRGEGDRARALHGEALTLYEQLGDRSGVALAQNALANLARLRGELDAALQLYMENLGIYAALGDEFGLSFSARNVGDCHFLRGEFDQARRFYDESLAMSRRLENKFGMAFGLVKVGNLFAAMGDFVRAQERYDEALVLMERMGKRYGIAEIHLRRAAIEYQRGRYRETLEELKAGLDLLEALGEKQGIALVFHGRANVYRDRGDYGQALECYEKSLVLHEEIGARAAVARIHHDLGNLYRDRGEYDEAVRRYGLADCRYVEGGDGPGQAHLATDRADLLQRRGAYERALDLYEEARELWTSMGLPDGAGVAHALEGIAMIRADRGDYARARGIFEEALEIRRRLEMHAGEARGLDNLACLDALEGDFEKARDLHRRSLDIFQALDNRREMQKTLGCLSNLHRNLGDYEEAMRLSDEAFRIAQQLGDRRGMAISLNQSALLEACRDRSEAARLLFETSLSIKRDLEDDRGVVATLLPLARVLLVLGQYRRARQLLDEAEDLACRLGYDRSLITAELLRAELEIRRDDVEAVEDVLGPCRERIRALDDPEMRAQLLRVEGLFAFKTGARGEATRLLEEALEAFQRLASDFESRRVAGELGALTKDELVLHLERRGRWKSEAYALADDIATAEEEEGEELAVMALLVKPLGSDELRSRFALLLEEQGGRPFASAGEALLVEFSTVSSALEGARRLSSLRLRAAEGPSARPAMAIDRGPSLRRGKEWVGGPASLVLRLVRLVPDGGTLVTERAHRPERTDEDWIEIEAQTVREMDEPMRVFLRAVS